MSKKPDLDPALFRAIQTAVGNAIATLTPADLAPLAAITDRRKWSGAAAPYAQLAGEVAFVALNRALGWDKLPTPEECEQEAARYQAEIDAKVAASKTPAT